MKKFFPIIFTSFFSTLALISFTSDQAKSIQDDPIYRFVPENSKFNVMVNLKDPYSKKLLSNTQLKDEFDELFDSTANTNNIIDLLEETGEALLIYSSDIESKNGSLVVRTSSDTLKNNLVKAIKSQVKIDKSSQLVETKYKDVSLMSVIPKDAKNYNFKPYYYAFLGKNILFTSDVENIQDTIKAYYGNNLLNNSRFKSIKKYIDSSSQVKLYFDTLKEKSLFKASDVIIGIKFNNKSIDFNYSAMPLSSDKFSNDFVKKKTKNLSYILKSLPPESLGFLSTSGYNFYESMNATNKKEQEKLREFFKTVLNITPDQFFGNINGEYSLAVINNKDIEKFPMIAMFMKPKDKDFMLETLSTISIDTKLFSDKGNRKNTNNQKQKFSFSQLRKQNGFGIVSSTEIEELKKLDIRPEYMFVDDKLILTSSSLATNMLVDRIMNNASNLENSSNIKPLKKILTENNTDIGYLNLDLLFNIASRSMQGNKKEKALIPLMRKFHSAGFNAKNDTKSIYGKLSLIVDWQEIDANLIQELTTGKKSDIKIKEL